MAGGSGSFFKNCKSEKVGEYVRGRQEGSRRREGEKNRDRHHGIKDMNNGWIGKGDGFGGGSRGRGRGRGDLTRVKPLKPAKEVSDEKRSRGEVALFRVIKS